MNGSWRCAETALCRWRGGNWQHSAGALAHLRTEHPEWDAAYVRTAASRYVSPPEIAPHSAGAAEDARSRRGVLGTALTAVGLVNYPTEWWHWSYGDRYWALETGAAVALYGPTELDRAQKVR